MIHPEPVNRPRVENRLIILALHHVGAPPPLATRRKLYITASALDSHVRWLQGQGYRFTTLSQALSTPGDASGNMACITIDDGFTDALVALPVPATLFAITSRVGEKNVTLDEGTAPGDLATWEQLEALRKKGWEIGSHAHRHVRLPTLSAQQQADELGESARVLNERLGEARSLAYPYGAYDDASIAAAKSAGFLCAATTKSGRASLSEPYRLRRVILSSFGALDSLERLKLFGVHRGLYPLHERPL
jgi:peptidoglycan/xylan/chitin deacetylase (PgdA/CDA1 family)